MYKIEYLVKIGEDGYYFEVSNESLTVLKRNTKKDILDFARMKNLPVGECIVEMTILYDEEYYDGDEFELVISENYETTEMVA